MLRSFTEKTAKLSIEDSEQTPITVPEEQPVDPYQVQPFVQQQ
jgi:hypothetical protein